MSIKEIANRAGVSTATVSRVLNTPNYKCSSPELRNKIWKIAMEMNYSPNEAARNLRRGNIDSDEKTYTIQVIVTRTNQSGADPFYAELLREIESEIHKNLCILSSVTFLPILSDEKKGRYTNWDDYIQKYVDENNENCDGLIVIGKCRREALLKLKQCYPNIICINRNSTNYEVDEILCDGQKIAETAVEYLIKLGHTELGYVGDCHKESRYQGFLKTLDKHDIELEHSYIMQTDQTEKEGYECMKKWLKSDACPTGIYCANDITAVGMLKCLQKYKNRYFTPSIIASDDIECAQETKPMLTTVRLPKDNMAKLALYLLIDRMKGGHKDIIRVELEGKLMIRNSCLPANESNWNDYCI